MLRSILPTPTYDHLFSSDASQGGDGGGSGGSGGGTPPATPPAGGDGGTGGGEKQVPQSKVDEIVRGRVSETQTATEARIAKDLGVPLDEAKRLIAEAKKREDSEKTEAQRARDEADAEKAAAETEKSEAAKARHEAAIERQILRNLTITEEMTDEDIDKKVGRLARLVDVEVGADAAAVQAAVKALKDDEPLMFGGTPSGEGGERKPAAEGDPKGTPPKKTGAEDAFSKGKQRAAGQGAAAGYPILEPTT